MDRTTAYLLVKQHLRRFEGRERARRAEVVMEAFAQHMGEDCELWAVMGLLSAVDLEYAASNPHTRFVKASEHAATEGLDAALCAALRHEARTPATRRIQDALTLTWALIERPDTESAAVEALGRELELERGRGDSASEQLDRAIDAMGGGLDQWIDVALSAQRALREEQP